MSWFTRCHPMIRTAAAFTASASAIIWAASERTTVTDELKETYNEKTSDPKETKFNLGTVLASWTTNFKPSVLWDNNWDRRDPSSCVKPAGKDTDGSLDYKERLKKATPTASRHLFLIRHGQYVMDAPDDSGRFLTNQGQDQAACTGKRLKELDYPYTMLINSTMTRAKDTANIVHTYLENVPRMETDMLREGSPYPPEPPVGHYRPEAEYYQDGSRIEAAFRKLFHRASPSQEKNSYEVVVCHANVIRYFVCRAMQFPPEAWLRISLRHGSITHVVIRPSGRIVLTSLGDSGHIPSKILS